MFGSGKKNFSRFSDSARHGSHIRISENMAATVRLLQSIRPPNGFPDTTTTHFPAGLMWPPPPERKPGGRNGEDWRVLFEEKGKEGWPRLASESPCQSRTAEFFDKSCLLTSPLPHLHPSSLFTLPPISSPVSSFPSPPSPAPPASSVC